MPGQAEKSELVRRILSTDDDRADAAAGIEEVADGRGEGIAPALGRRRGRVSGALGFHPPVRPPVPAVKNDAWPKNDIDRFILARLEKEGLQPSPPADRVTLLRRLTLDLTGLPPSDRRRLTAKKPTKPRPTAHCSLRRTTANAGAASGSTPPAMPTPTATKRTSRGSSGSIATGSSSALNRDLPYDQFVIEQLAGDLLPECRRRTSSSPPASCGTR